VLSSKPGNYVFIVSGRKRSQLNEWFGNIRSLGLAAEKGCFIRWPDDIVAQCREPFNAEETTSADSSKEDNLNDWENLTRIADAKWKLSFMEIIKDYTRHTDGSWIEPKENGIVWHFENADPEYGIMQAAELCTHLQEINPDPRIEVVRADFHRILEVKPVGVSKGSTCTRILQKLNALLADDEKPFVLVIGDDRSDEEMFIATDKVAASIAAEKATAQLNDLSATNSKLPEWKLDRDEDSNTNRLSRRTHLPNLFTTCVGIKPSNAHYYVHDDEEVRHLIEILVSIQLDSPSRLSSREKKNQ
jgi:trehalose 6-phosphate synthase/phosphatase